MSEDRSYYVQDRVLIETARVRDRATIRCMPRLTDAELDIIRNVLEYAHRRETFVTTYYPTYYEIPDATDWDEIQRIVAELEYKLMAVPNLIGYTTYYRENKNASTTGIGDYTMDTQAVPDGVVRILENATVRNLQNAVLVEAGIYYGTQHRIILRDPIPSVTTVMQTLKWPILLRAGEVYRVIFKDCGSGDNVRGYFFGYDSSIEV
jgi:hypothetical protein